MPETELEPKSKTHLRRTVVVEGRYARRWHQTQAAIKGEHGLLVVSMEELAARLAGGFLRSVRTDTLKTSVREAVAAGPLDDLETIKDLPGFQRAAAATLAKAWRAGLNLGHSANPRTRSLAALERNVRSRLPKNQLPHAELAKAAMERAALAPAVLGRIEIHGRTELSPVWRDLLLRLSGETDLTWVAGARSTPDWLSETDVAVSTTLAAEPDIRAVSCATPRHETRETLRWWARKHLTEGIPAHHIAITAASPALWDDHMMALAQDANLPDGRRLQPRTDSLPPRSPKSCCAGCRAPAWSALAREETPLRGQRTWAEVQFGYARPRKTSDGTASLPWDLATPVYIEGTRIRIGGFIDRLDLSDDRRQARVTDYKSWKYPRRCPQINGGAELQRCLYAFAVRTLVPTRPEVEARLVYPRNDDMDLVLDDTEETLAGLVKYLNAATELFVEGKTLNGPAAADRYYDPSFALPGGSKQMYLKTKEFRSTPALMPLSDLEARIEALTHHDRSLLVEAGAGSGKTALMAGRAAILVAGGIAPRNIAAITFTEAAAAELLERIERIVKVLLSGKPPDELAPALPTGLSDGQRANLKRSAATLGELTCTTIHSFCQKLITPYPAESGQDPGATIFDPAVVELVFDDLLDRWLSARFGRNPAEDKLGRMSPIRQPGDKEEDLFASLLWKWRVPTQREALRTSPVRYGSGGKTRKTRWRAVTTRRRMPFPLSPCIRPRAWNGLS